MSLRWIPNSITIVRLILIWPILLALLDRRFDAALVLMVVAGFSDALDGFLASTFDWKTRLGGLLDPVADKLLITSAFVTLSYMMLVPTGLTAIIVARDTLIVAGALAYASIAGYLSGEPSLVSKANTFLQLSFLALAIFDASRGWIPPEAMMLLGAAVIFTSITSGLAYVIEWSRRAIRGGTASA